MALTCTDILTQTPHGLCCPMGGFHIDPVRPVARALITHGHSDHARAGHGAVLATRETLRIMAARYGADFAGSSEAAALGEERRIGEVTVRFVPAVHVLGSAQIVIEAGGCRIVVSGDYKREADPTCRPFELVPCDVFITEATFGLPLFRAAGHDAPIYLHGAIEPLTALYKSEGIDLGDTPKATAAKKSELAGRIVLAPPSATQDLWSRRLPDPVTAFASGWMRVRARARQKGVELPLVISDHADWDDLCATIAETGAGEVWVTHGQEDALVHWCRTRGLAARPLHMLGYGDEEEGGAAEAARLPAGPDETTGAAGHTGDSS